MLIDAHAHLDLYKDNLQAALQEIEAHRILTIGTSMDPDSYQRNIEIARQSDWILPTFGIHPWRAPQHAQRLDELQLLVENSPLLGEIGLDFHWVEDASCYPAQRRVFEFFLAAAKEQEKIVNLHTKGAEAEILELLNQYQIGRAIIHWYSGPLDVFRQMVDRGLMFTIGVEVSHSERIQALAQELPPSQLLTETDNPGGLKWLSGRPGMPHHLQEVVQAIASLKETTAEAIAHTVRDNFARLIQDDPWLVSWHNRLQTKAKNTYPQ